MSAVSKLDITIKFADETTQKITINNLVPANITNATAIENIRSKVMAFNANQGGTLASKMKSKNGFNWIAITKATVTTTDKSYIF